MKTILILLKSHMINKDLMSFILVYGAFWVHFKTAKCYTVEQNYTTQFISLDIFLLIYSILPESHNSNCGMSNQQVLSLTHSTYVDWNRLSSFSPIKT